MFAEHDKHYPSRSGQTSLATAITNITKPCYKELFRAKYSRDGLKGGTKLQDMFSGRCALSAFGKWNVSTDKLDMEWPFVQYCDFVLASAVLCFIVALYNAGSRQDNTTFSPHIHGTFCPPFRPSQ